MILTQERQKLLAANVKKFYQNNKADYIHDFDHTIRVTYWASHLCEKEGGNTDIIIPAALLHDTGIPLGGNDMHARYAAEHCDEFLLDVGYDGQEIKQISEAIGQHSTDDVFCGERTLNGNILFDADKLDTVGPVALCRWIGGYQDEGYMIHECLRLVKGHIESFRAKYGEDIFFTETAKEIGRPLLKYVEQRIVEMIEDVKRYDKIYEELGVRFIL